LKIPAGGSLDLIRGALRDTLTRIMPQNEQDIELEKDEIWGELSLIYFKYDNEIWRQAFREVMIEVYDKISDVRWSEIYTKIYAEAKK